VDQGIQELVNYIDYVVGKNDIIPYNWLIKKAKNIKRQ